MEIPQYQLSPRLARLFQCCETNCAAGCCGIFAFEFTPLHIAAHLAAGMQPMEESVAAWLTEIDEFDKAVSAIPENAEGRVCSIEQCCHSFTRSELQALVAELRHNIKVAPRMLNLADELAFRPTAYEVTHQVMAARQQASTGSTSDTPP